MVNLRTCALSVLTLLQLCRAEILDTLPEWYSANVINDGFQPKSISEIFSTESSFSSTNPIVVLPKSSTVPDEILLLSSLGTRNLGGSTSAPSGFTKVFETSLSPSTTPPTQPTQPPSMTPTLPPSPTPSTTFSTSPAPQPTITQTLPPSSVQTLPPSSAPTEPPPSPVQNQVQQTTPVSQSTLFEGETTQSQTQLQQNQSQQIRVEVLPLPQVQPILNQSPNVIGQFPSQISQQPGMIPQKEPLSNFFLIYQQAPQNIQGQPSAPAGPRDTADFMIAANPSTPPSPASPISITNPVPTVQTLSAVFTQPPPIPTSSRSLPSTIRTSPTFRPNNRTRDRNCPQRLPATTPIPRPMSFGGGYPLSIRVVAPVGSITNVRINPTTSTTTRRPTTTRTRRTRKPKRNTYERCVDACRGNRDPICAVPLASTPIDVNTLKGFPSVCHMACHNSYRKQPYEKLSDGCCGRLRTRIQAVGTNAKFTRDELNKAQYTVVDSGPQTIVEFSGLP